MMSVITGFGQFGSYTAPWGRYPLPKKYEVECCHWHMIIDICLTTIIQLAADTDWINQYKIL